MIRWYRLEGKTPVLVGNTEKYIQAMKEKGEKLMARVGWDLLPGEVIVSTVFLGMDHSLTPGARPVLFETHIFGGPLDSTQVRYCTWEEAEKGHRDLVTQAKVAGAPPWR